MALRSQSGSFSVDLLLNYVAFTVTAISGLAFLLICAAYLGMAGLGVVSQVMALYVILGQLAVGGIQFSALQTAADPGLDDEARRPGIWSAIFTAAMWGALVAVVASSGSELAGQLFSSPPVGQAWAHVAPALALFALNKAAASALNGLNRMRRFALQMGLRAILLATFAWLLTAKGAGPVEVCWAFLGAETLLSIYLLAQMLLILGWPNPAALAPERLGRHLSFGLRGLWSGLAYEINVRLDVLMVGLFLNDAAVGLYGLVAQLAEGFFNILVVLRTQLAPMLSRLVAHRDVMALRRLAFRLLTIGVPAAALVATVGTVIYAPAVTLLLPGQGYEAGTSLLAILLFGLVINAWLMPFETLLIVSGNPGLYSLMMMGVVATNAVANLALVPLFGLHGAATATCLATVLSGVYLLLAVRHRLGCWLAPSRSGLANGHRVNGQSVAHRPVRIR